MRRFVAVDAGKSDTKIGTYDGTTTNIYGFTTKIGTGYFEDDALERNTFIAEINGKVYKMGQGADTEAELETSKQTEIHKMCILSAIAMCCSDNEEDEVSVAIGVPMSTYNSVPMRNEFREYMLGQDTYTIKLKMRSDAPVKTKRFKIVDKVVYPESSGGLFIDGAIDYAEGTVGVIDLGWLNNNLSVFRAGEPDKKMTKTNELGGSRLVRGLAAELSSHYARIDARSVAEILSLPSDFRCLNSDDESIRESSNQFIHDYVVQYIREIKQDINDRGWGEFMKLVAIGGISRMLETELKEEFGSKLFIPNQAQFANVVGFLRMLYAKVTDSDEIIPMPESMKIITTEEEVA